MTDQPHSFGDETLQKPVALVTGGSRGIGFAAARLLGENGWDLAINGVRDKSQVSEALEELEKTGARVAYCRGDVGSTEGRAGIMEALEKSFGHVNLLVNNAGVAPKERLDILDATEESFERLMRINLQGPYFLTQAIARRMVAQKQKWSAPGKSKDVAKEAAGDAGNASNQAELSSGNPGTDVHSAKASSGYAEADVHPAKASSEACIINIGSISATVVSIMRGDYCISKAGFAMHSRLWAVRLAEYGIPVYEIRPGVIQTDMTAGVKEKYDKLLAGGLTVQPRWGLPDDVGRAVLALANGSFPYSSGEVFMVDGGLTVTRL